MPNDKIGVIVLVIVTTASAVQRRQLQRVTSAFSAWINALEPAPTHGRLAGKKAGTEARAKAGGDRVPNTKPSHAWRTTLGEYENSAYGISRSGKK